MKFVENIAHVVKEQQTKQEYNVQQTMLKEFHNSIEYFQKQLLETSQTNCENGVKKHLFWKPREY